MSLVLQDFSVRYGSHVVVQETNLSALPEGSVVALVGANGAGKSSTLRALAGLHPMRGQAWLDGVDLAHLSATRRAQQVAYMPQSLPQATALTIFESVLGAVCTACPQWSRAEALRRVETVLIELDLESLALQPLAALSGGQRQMAGLAQLLARAPRLMLLDEPTSALDLRWQLCLMQALQAHVQREGAVCLMAVHDLNLAARFSREWLVLAQGRVLARGAPAQVLTPELLQQAYGIEARIEVCSLGSPIIIAERAVALPTPLQ